MWFLNNLARFDKERKAITTLIAEVDWLPFADWRMNTDNETQLSLVADIQVHGQRYPVVMLYPSHYPASPPTVRPREANQPWSTHQYLSGELCLEWGPDTWRDDITGAEMLRSAYNLLATETPTEEGLPRRIAPSRHSLELGQELRFTCWRFLVNASLVSYTQTLSDNANGTAHFWVMCNRAAATAFVRQITPASGERWDNPELPLTLEKTTIPFEARFFKVKLESNALASLKLDVLIQILDAQGHDVSPLSTAAPGPVLLIDEAAKLHLFWISTEKEWHRFTPVYIRSEEDNLRLPHERSPLVTKTVGIVGLGSAGSKIALSLARTGIRNFLLIDYDVFLPENLCRHELTWEDVGQHKVDSIARQLKLIARDVNVKSSCAKMSGQEATATIASLLSQLGTCDLIIDATADAATFNQVATVGIQQQTPIVWLEFFAGGIGGMIARFRPNRDPEPKTMRAYLNKYLAEQDVPTLRATVDYTAVDTEGEVMSASDADVAVIAANATRMALDILTAREPSAFPYSLYLIGLTRGWIFEQPFYTLPIDMSDAPSPCAEPALSAASTAENVQFLSELISQQENENSSTA